MGRIFSGQIRPRLCEIPPRKGKLSMMSFLRPLFSARSKECSVPL
nr:MAG TPA: hypothetical protein [Caudoviricetes sp.]DAJ21934.1 MAG TPA: hypothetical protein [Siphoviridae sp. ctHdl3]